MAIKQQDVNLIWTAVDEHILGCISILVLQPMQEDFLLHPQLLHKQPNHQGLILSFLIHKKFAIKKLYVNLNQ